MHRLLDLMKFFVLPDFLMSCEGTLTIMGAPPRRSHPALPQEMDPTDYHILKTTYGRSIIFSKAALHYEQAQFMMKHGSAGPAGTRLFLPVFNHGLARYKTLAPRARVPLKLLVWRIFTREAHQAIHCSTGAPPISPSSLRPSKDRLSDQVRLLDRIAKALKQKRIEVRALALTLIDRVARGDGVGWGEGGGRRGWSGWLGSDL